MNKKIFTLLVGALLSIGSSFTASAQTPTVHYKEVGGVYFADTLRADTAKNLKPEAYYLLSITDIANPTDIVSDTFPDLISKSKPSRELSYVMFVDSAGQLRMDTIKALDNDSRYQFRYKGSSKIEAIRRASWCVSTSQDEVAGSNVVFDFNNMATGEMLEAPLQTLRPNLWAPDLAGGQGRLVYKGEDGNINLITDDELIVSGWHFSQTHIPTQELQTGMPLYSFVGKDSVLVLAIDDDIAPPINFSYENPSHGEGGWKVTVKYVAVNDLIRDEAGNVRLSSAGGKYVSNVLLFTLKKLDKFVLNAYSYLNVSKPENAIPENH